MDAYPPSLASLHDERAAAAALTAPDFPEMHCVVPGLYLGSQRAAGILFPYEERDPAVSSVLRSRALQTLRSAGIANVVCCSAAGARVFAGDGIAYECGLLNDGGSQDILDSTPAFAELLGRAIALVKSARSRGEGTLVHCASGAHRSASVLCGVLMHERRAPLAAVLPLVLRQRPFARPTFWRHLVGVLEPLVLTPPPPPSAEAAAAGPSDTSVASELAALATAKPVSPPAAGPLTVLLVGDSTLDNVVWVEVRMRGGDRCSAGTCRARG